MSLENYVLLCSDGKENNENSKTEPENKLMFSRNKETVRRRIGLENGYRFMEIEYLLHFSPWC